MYVRKIFINETMFYIHTFILNSHRPKLKTSISISHEIFIIYIYTKYEQTPRNIMTTYNLVNIYYGQLRARSVHCFSFMLSTALNKL